MSTGEGIFLGLTAVAAAVMVAALMVCMTWQGIQERARSNSALTPPPGPAQSRRRSS